MKVLLTRGQKIKLANSNQVFTFFCGSKLNTSVGSTTMGMVSKPMFQQTAFVVLALTLFSCNASKRIPGRYSTKFASNGFFWTLLELQTDSSFFYQFSGDMINKKAIGNYTIRNRNIELRYVPSKNDSFLIGVKEDTVWALDKKSFKIITVGTPISIYDSAEVETRPREFYYKNGKLFRINSKGKLYKGKGFVYSPRRKYILFGRQYFHRRNPLRKIRRTKDI